MFHSGDELRHTDREDKEPGASLSHSHVRNSSCHRPEINMSTGTGSGSAGLTAHQEGFLIVCSATEENMAKELECQQIKEIRNEKVQFVLVLEDISC